MADASIGAAARPTAAARANSHCSLPKEFRLKSCRSTRRRSIAEWISGPRSPSATDRAAVPHHLIESAIRPIRIPPLLSCAMRLSRFARSVTAAS